MENFLGRRDKLEITKNQVENTLGFHITEEMFENSLEYAKRKLCFIISQFGDEGGIRQRTEYLLILICESIQAECFSEITILTTISMQNMEKERSAICQNTPHASIL